MKHSYSLLLSEYVQANTVTHGDCARWQLTCPSCKEPLFKVERPSNTETQHFFAHYNRDKAYNEECELRCASITQNQIDAKAITSRNQKLQYFLCVLNYWILEEHRRQFLKTGAPEAAVLIDIGVEQIGKSPGASYLLQDLYQYQRSNRNTTRFKNGLVSMLEMAVHMDFSVYGEETKLSEFTTATRKQIATDIFSHLLSHKARPSYAYLFCNAYFKTSHLFREMKVTLDRQGAGEAKTIFSPRQTTDHISSKKDDLEMSDFLDIVVSTMNLLLTRTTEKQTVRLLDEFANSPLPTFLINSWITNPVEFLSHFILSSMFQFLLNLPIEEILSNAKTNKPAPTRDELLARQEAELDKIAVLHTHQRFSAADITGQKQ